MSLVCFAFVDGCQAVPGQARRFVTTMMEADKERERRSRSGGR